MTFKFRSTYIAAFLSAGLLLTASSSALAGPPTDFLKKTSAEVSKLLEQKDSQKRQKAFSTKLNTTVDFRELASRALGEHWAKQSAENQQEFLDLLQKLLEANYRDQLTGQVLDEDYTIEYLNERTRDDMAIVDTQVKWDSSQKPVGYKLLKKNSGWVIFDIVIDDISLLETYRDSYTEIIEKEGWDSLIERMKKRVKDVEAAAK